MSGHSKWAQIKRQKGANDAKRGQIFTKLGREITVAARQGGSDPEANYRLRLAIQKAREQNMPMENIDRAIKRAGGGADSAALEEVTYEGYGPGGTAILLQAFTDNRNRTVAEIRNLFTRGGGSLGEGGCVAWLFDQRGVITVEAGERDADEIALVAIDAGAEDVSVDGESIEVYTAPEDLETVRRGLDAQDLHVVSAELAMIPKTTVRLGEKDGLQALKLLERLEDLDDVQRVFSNADIPEEVLQKYEG